tara:strand:+ start:534 stop:2219 length:1686 start_codon:yes stop_codon:yes gene_type:complete
MSNGKNTNWITDKFDKIKSGYSNLKKKINPNDASFKDYFSTAVGDLKHIVAGEFTGAKREFNRQKSISSEDFHKGASYNYGNVDADRVMRPHTAEEIKNKEEYMSTVGDESKLQAIMSGGFFGLAKNLMTGNSKEFDYNLATNKDFGGGYSEATPIGDRFKGYLNDLKDGKVTYTEPVKGTTEGQGDFMRNWWEAGVGNAVDIGDHSDNDPTNALARFNRDRNWFTEEGFKDRTRLLNEKGMSAKDFYTRRGNNLLAEGETTDNLTGEAYENAIDFDTWNNPNTRFAMQTAGGEFLQYDDSLTMEENLKNNPGATLDDVKSQYEQYDNLDDYRESEKARYSDYMGDTLEDESASLYFVGKEGRDFIHDKQDTINMVKKSKYAPGKTKNGDSLTEYASYPMAYHLDRVGEQGGQLNSPFTDPFGYNEGGDEEFLEKIKGVGGLQMVEMLQDEYGYEAKEPGGPRTRPIGKMEDVGLGAYQQSMGFDAETNRPYFAFYDKYDLNPIGGSGGEDLGAGTAYEVYDRIYLTQDPEGNWGYDLTDVTEDDVFRNGNVDKPFEIETN